MATPTSRETFKEYCLRTLGKPVVDINVDDQQVEDRIDDAFEKAKSTPLSADSLMDHCFSSDTARQSRQRSFLMDSLGQANE